MRGKKVEEIRGSGAEEEKAEQRDPKNPRNVRSLFFGRFSLVESANGKEERVRFWWEITWAMRKEKRAVERRAREVEALHKGENRAGVAISDPTRRPDLATRQRIIGSGFPWQNILLIHILA